MKPPRDWLQASVECLLVALVLSECGEAALRFMKLSHELTAAEDSLSANFIGYRAGVRGCSGFGQLKPAE